MVNWEEVAAEYKKQNYDLARAIRHLSEELVSITEELSDLAADNKRLYIELDKVKIENVYLKKQIDISI